MMRTILMLLCCVYLVQAEQEPLVRAAVTSTPPIIVGQAVRVKVTVLVPNYFLGEPEFPQLNIENAIVILPQETPQNSNETTGGQTFAGISVTYLIYPQQPGTFKLPAAEVAVKYASHPPEAMQVRLPIPALAFNAIIPPQAADLDYFLPTNSLAISQAFDKPLKNVKVGDTITRTVTVTASNLRAMLIPPTKFDVPAGMSVYPKQPSVDDMKTDRGEFLGGKRVDSATYLIRKEGEYTLPAIQIEWWNLSTSKVQTAILPAIQFVAAPNPSVNAELAPEPEPVPVQPPPRPPFRHYMHEAVMVAILVAAVVVFLWLWLRFGRRFSKRWAEWRLEQRESENAHFSRLRNACSIEDAADAYRSFLAWLRRFQPGVDVSRFLSEAGDGELKTQVESLAAALYGSSAGSTWSGKRMIQALERLRSGNRDIHRKHRRVALPPLNPAIGSRSAINRN